MKILAALLVLSSVARADPMILRIGTVAPEGTAWARELQALGRDVDTATEGRVRLKWAFGGIAGDERETLGRIRRGQLDGMAASHFCEKLAPTLRVMRTFGVLRSRAEERYVVQNLRDQIDRELDKEGMVEIGVLSLGMAILFSREPVRTMKELVSRRWWVSSDDDFAVGVAEKLGMKVVPLPQSQARAAFDEHKFDGFIAIPASIIAFQWTGVRAFTDLPLGSVDGCLVIAHRSWDRLPVDDQTAIRGAAMKAMARLDDVSDEQQKLVLAEIGPKLGIVRVQPDEDFRATFLEAAQEARAGQLPAELLTRVLALLADYRVMHR